MTLKVCLSDIIYSLSSKGKTLYFHGTQKEDILCALGYHQIKKKMEIEPVKFVIAANSRTFASCSFAI